MRLMIPAITTVGVVALFATYGSPTAPPSAVDKENAVPIETIRKSWTCPTCTDNEKYVLQQLQEKTRISDRNALATIMGNIQQESKFIPNICEGGARVPYNACHSGGYGLIQWTSVGRYRNLGMFAKRYG